MTTSARRETTHRYHNYELSDIPDSHLHPGTHDLHQDFSRFDSRNGSVLHDDRLFTG